MTSVASEQIALVIYVILWKTLKHFSWLRSKYQKQQQINVFPWANQLPINF